MFRHVVAAFVAGLVLAGGASAQPISREDYQKQLDARRAVIEVMNRDADPMAWAKAHTDFGKDLYLFDSLDEAITAFRSALEVYSREATPKEWAETEKLMGLSFQKRAAMKGMVGFFVAFGGQSGPDPTADLSDGLQAFAAAEQVYTRAEFPRDWVLLQYAGALSHALLAERQVADDSARQEHRDAATAKYNNILEDNAEPLDHFLRALAHKGLSTLNERGYENETERIRFALEHAKLAKTEFTAAGEAEQAETMDRKISSLEYELKRAEEYVPGELDSLFGARHN